MAFTGSPVIVILLGGGNQTEIIKACCPNINMGTRGFPSFDLESHLTKARPIRSPIPPRNACPPAIKITNSHTPFKDCPPVRGVHSSVDFELPIRRMHCQERPKDGGCPYPCPGDCVIHQTQYNINRLGISWNYPDRGLDLITKAGGREITWSL